MDFAVNPLSHALHAIVRTPISHHLLHLRRRVVEADFLTLVELLQMLLNEDWITNVLGTHCLRTVRVEKSRRPFDNLAIEAC